MSSKLVTRSVQPGFALVTRSVFTAQQNRTLTGQLDLSLNVLQLPCCALEAF